MPENFPWMWFIEQPLTYSKKTITTTKKGLGSKSVYVNLCGWVPRLALFFLEASVINYTAETGCNLLPWERITLGLFSTVPRVM